MDSLEDLLINNLSKNTKLMAVQHAAIDLSRIDQLWKWLNNASDPLRWRACWVFEELCLKHRHILDNYVLRIAELYPKLTHDSLRRMLGHLLTETHIPEDHETKILDAAYAWMLDPTRPAAVRIHAMQLVFNLTKKYPELQNEFRSAIEHLYDTGSKGFKNRAGKLLKRL